MKLELMIGNSEEEAARSAGGQPSAERRADADGGAGANGRPCSRRRPAPNRAYRMGAQRRRRPAERLRRFPVADPGKSGPAVGGPLGPVLRLPGRAAGQSARRLAAGANAASL